MCVRFLCAWKLDGDFQCKKYFVTPSVLLHMFIQHQCCMTHCLPAFVITTQHHRHDPMIQKEFKWIVSSLLFIKKNSSCSVVGQLWKKWPWLCCTNKAAVQGPWSGGGVPPVRRGELPAAYGHHWERDTGQAFSAAGHVSGVCWPLLQEKELGESWSTRLRRTLNQMYLYTCTCRF